MLKFERRTQTRTPVIFYRVSVQENTQSFLPKKPLAEPVPYENSSIIFIATLYTYLDNKTPSIRNVSAASIGQEFVLISARIGGIIWIGCSAAGLIVAEELKKYVLSLD